MTKQRYVLFDGNNISHIAFHRAKSIVYKEIAERLGKSARQIDPAEDLTADEIDQIKGMMFHVFFLKIHKIFKKFRNARYLVAWDAAGASNWRKSIYPEYKSNRVYTEDPTWTVLFDGIKELKEILKSYPVYQTGFESLEADDILYAYAEHLHEDYDVVIVSTDSDLVQISQKFGTKIFHPLNQKYVDIPQSYDICYFKALDGEKGDGIPGVKGYGKKRAQRLAEAIAKDPDAIDELNDEQQEIFLRNVQLIDISNNPNLSKVVLELDKLEEATDWIDLDKIRKFYFDKKLRQLLETFESVAAIFSK